MRHIEIDPHICSVDPITLTGLALAGLAGGATAAFAGGGTNQPATPAATPTPPAAPPPVAAPPTTSPAGSSQSLKGSQPSFVGASAAPSSDFGQKTLVGA
jgi:hypothetical protein